MHTKKTIATLALLVGAFFSAFIGYSHGLLAGVITYAACDSLCAFWIVPNAGVAFNTFGAMAATGILHDALGLTLKKLPFIAAMVKNVKEMYGDYQMPFNVAQTLKDYNANLTVVDRAATGTYFAQNSQAVTLPANKTLTLDQWPSMTLRLTALEIQSIVDSATNADARALAVQKLLARGFNQFATRIVNDFLGVITAANFPAVEGVNPLVSTAGTMDYKFLGTVTDALLQVDALTESPSAVLSIPAHRELANSLLNIANASVDVDDVLQTAEIKTPVSGCRSATRYNVAMPADAPRGVVLDPLAIIMANRIPREETVANDSVYLEPIVDPATGFQILYREAKDPGTGEVHRTITTMYGFAPALTNHLIRLTAAAPVVG